MRANSSRAKSRAPSRLPSPGPSTTASARSIAFSAGPAASRRSAPSSSGSPTIIASSSRTVNDELEACRCADASRSPRRRASRPARDIDGAPVSPGEPPTTNTVPEENFVESAPRPRQAAQHAGADQARRRASPGAPRGIPMSTTCDLARVRLAGVRSTGPGLARVEGRGGDGADRRRPRPRRSRRRRRSGMSAATTGAPGGVDRRRSPRRPARAARPEAGAEQRVDDHGAP